MNFWDKAKEAAVLIGLLFFLLPARCKAEDLTEGMLEDLHLQDVEQTVKELLEPSESFTDILKDLLQGKSPVTVGQIKEKGRTILWNCLGIQQESIRKLLVLLLLAAVCSNLAQAFADRSLETFSFYLICLFLFVTQIRIFREAAEELENCLGGITGFMQVLLPAYDLTITAATGTSTAAAFYQMMLFLIYLVERLFLAVLFPCVRMYFLLSMIQTISEEEVLSRMTDLLQKGIRWFLKTMIGVVMGMQMLQRLLLPAVDSLKRTAVGKTAGALPGIGNLWNSVTEVVLGSAVLIKNGFGVAAVIILLLLGLAPMIQLGTGAVFYQLLAALAQPITDRRITGCIQALGESLALLFRILITVELLFLVTIAVLAGSLH